jgi:hypothetical protein
VATVTGGAIHIFGATHYQVLDSTFYGNTVAPATWMSTTPYALILTTAAAGASEQTSPMWSIDDGPVFGLSTADCNVARQASAQGIDRGLAPSWPGTAPCTNDTVYQSFELYTHSLVLSQGDHVLHLGAFARSSFPTVNWPGGGKIEVLGLLAPTFPAFDDDRRKLRHPGCAQININEDSCPVGEAFWIDLRLHVGVGKVRRPSMMHRLSYIRERTL